MVHTHRQEIIYVKTDHIKPYPGNANMHPEEQIEALAQSFRQFGFIGSVYITPEYELIAGEGRWLAAQRAGLDEVPAIIVSHLNDAQRRAFVLADNKLGGMSTLDFAKLSDELSKLSTDGFDLGFTFFDDAELNALLKDDFGLLPDFLPPISLPISTDVPAQPPAPVPAQEPVVVTGSIDPPPLPANDAPVSNQPPANDAGDGCIGCPHCGHRFKP